MKSFKSFQIPITLCILLSVTHTTANAQTIISKNRGAIQVTDSLVTGLSCHANIKSHDILSAIDKNKAFRLENQIPVHNWGFMAGNLIGIANCWSLSRAQRIMYYLGRFSEMRNTSIPHDETMVLNMIRGSIPEIYSTNDGRTWKLFENQNIEYKVFHMSDASLASAKNDNSSFWKRLSTLSIVREKNVEIERGFAAEIEAYQAKRFFQLQNIPMAIQTDTESTEHNLKMANKLKENINSNRLTLLHIRIETNIQHIVLVKNYNIDENGNIKFVVYDSEAPNIERTVIYEKSSNRFRSPEIVKHFLSNNNINRDLRVNIVDDDEMTVITSTLVKYYRSLCDSLRGF